MSKIHKKEILKDLIKAVKEDTGLDQIAYGELEYLLKYYCAPSDDLINIYKLVDGTANEIIIPPYLLDENNTFSYDFDTLGNHGLSIFLPKDSKLVTNKNYTDYYYLANSVVPEETKAYLPYKLYKENSDNYKTVVTKGQKINYNNLIKKSVDLLKNSQLTWGNYYNGLKTLFQNSKAENSLIKNYYNKETTDEELNVILKKVSKVAKKAFSNCLNLTTLNIPENITEIDETVFKGCTNIAEITASGSIKDLSLSLDCASINNVKILEGVEKLSLNFEENIENVYLPSTLKAVSTYGSKGGSGNAIKNLYIKDLTKYLQVNAAYSLFTPIYYAKNVYIDNILTTDLILPAGITSVSDRLFFNNPFSSITLPNSLLTIGKQAFSNSKNITEINIPDNVIEIGSSAFYNCINLKKIIIGKSVSIIGTYNFQADTLMGIGFNRIEDIIVSEENQNFKVENNQCLIDILNKKILVCCNKNENIIISSEITSISRAFCQCTRIISVSFLSDGLETIGSYSFYNCISLIILDLSNQTTIPVLEDTQAFYGVSSDFVIKVPAALLDEWKAATNWSVYADHIIAAS